MMPKLFLSLLLSLAVCLPAAAHKPSDSYLRIQGGGKRLTAEWDVALKDLELLVGLDRDGDSRITWGEVKAQREAIAAATLSRLALHADGEPVTLTATDLLIDEHSDGAYAVLVLDSDAPGDAATLDVRYALLFDADPTHRGLVLYQNGDASSTHVLSPERTEVEIRSTGVGFFAMLVDYVREGVWHIWIGFDHILFLVCLLLPAVLKRSKPAESQPPRWEPVERFGAAAKAVLKVVTMFTLAHSVTLWLAVQGWVELPGRWVESVIALSIVVTAVNNLVPRLPLSAAAVAFGFGLIHGFGFASVLEDLGLQEGTLGVALFGFNVGVELGQLAIVAVFLPIAWALRATRFYRVAVLRGGSVLIALLALVWFVERAFNTTILGI